MKKINYSNILIYCIYAIVTVFAFLAISSKFSIGGLRLLVVKSGSMEPAIKTGSIVIDKGFNDYNIGDVVTFKNKEKPKETTTHRIADKQCQRNICLFGTKGDANKNKDSEQIAQDRIVGKVMLAIPYLGYAAFFARTLPGLLFIIVIPAVIIIYEEMKKIHHETKHIIRKRRERKLSKAADEAKNIVDKESNTQPKVHHKKGERNEIS